MHLHAIRCPISRQLTNQEEIDSEDNISVRNSTPNHKRFLCGAYWSLVKTLREAGVAERICCYPSRPPSISMPLIVRWLTSRIRKGNVHSSWRVASEDSKPGRRQERTGIEVGLS